MTHIPDSEIQRLKRDTDLAALVEASGVTLKRHGGDLIGLCPFHDDKEPSLVVTPEKNLWHCLGACQMGGTAIDWVMKRDGVGFREAVATLQGAAPVAPLPRRQLRNPQSQAPPNPPAPSQDDQQLLEEVTTHYHQRLLASEPTLAYLRSRGLKDDDVIERFQLGYADRSLGSILDPAKRERLKVLGVLRSTGHEHLGGCLVVPILDSDGAVMNLYGRRIGRGQGPAHLYLPGPRRGVWNLSSLADSKEVILCEALLDALTFYVASFPHVTSSYGIQGFTGEHLGALKAHGIEKMLIAYDRDRAGDEAAEALAEKLSAEGIACSRVLFPKGMDANAYAVKVQPASESLGLLLESAEPMREPKQAAKEKTSPLPLAAPKSFDPFETTIGDRHWKVRGLPKNLSFERLKVVVRVSRGKAFFLDTVDLVAARQRAAFIKHAAVELDLKEEAIKRDLGTVHLTLEEHQERLIEESLKPQREEPPVMTPEDEHSALAYLKKPNLLGRILEDFSRCGIVGEETNKLVGYLAAVSRKLDSPLALLIQSSSAAGKSSLMEAILAFIPPEERVQYSAMTGQSLFYMGEMDLKHKILALVEEEGAERASYALKLLQSEGELTIASTGKDPETGKLVTHEYRVEGPVMLFLTTTSIEIDEELLNRCLVLTVDESREQTRAIHRLQRERRTLDGMLGSRRRSSLVALHRNLQRMLKPIPVVNPLARELTFLNSQTRTRRDHEKYLTLIDAIALLHQYQRPKKTATDRGTRVEYIEVELSDIEIANRLAGEVLGRSLDELAPQTRGFLKALSLWVTGECERRDLEREEFLFSRRDVVLALRVSLTQARTHLERLAEHEVVLTHRGGRGQSFVYELVWEGEEREGEPFLAQLIDTESLKVTDSSGQVTESNPKVADLKPHLTGSKRPQNGGVSGRWRTPETPQKANGDRENRPNPPSQPQNALLGDEQLEISASYLRPGGDG